jgi:chorismate mutase
MTLEKLRSEIDRVDSDIIRLIAQRQKISGAIAQFKISNNLPIHDEKRTDDVLKGVFDKAVESRIDPVATQKIFEMLIAMSEERQHECSGEGNLP